MKIKTIRKIDHKSNRFDIQTINENFFANDTLVHNSCMGIGVYPGLAEKDLVNGDSFIYSKGLGNKGLVFKNNEKNKDNVYLRVVEQTRNQAGLSILDRMKYVMTVKAAPYLSNTEPLYIFGEVFGDVQDLKYGMKNQIDFRAFDAYVGKPNQSRWLNVSEKTQLFHLLNVKMVPVLYQGPYTYEIATQYRDGNTVIGGQNIREGVVITPMEERYDLLIGRTILKHVSDAYLLRKNDDATEFN